MVDCARSTGKLRFKEPKENAVAAEIRGEAKRLTPNGGRGEEDSGPGSAVNIEVPLTGVQSAVNGPGERGNARENIGASKTLNAGVNESGQAIDSQDVSAEDRSPYTGTPPPSEAPDTFQASGTVGGLNTNAPDTSQDPTAVAGTYELSRDSAQGETLALKDALDRGHLAQELAKLLAERTDRHPIALGLWGPWGAGKSSLVEFLKSELAAINSAHFRFAQFNAWKHERVDNLGAALAQSVVEALVCELTFWQQTELALKLLRLRNARLRKAITKDVNRIWRSLVAAWSWTSAYVLPFTGPIVLTILALGLFMVDKPIWGSLGTFGAAVAGWVSVHTVRSKQLLDWFKDFLNGQRSSFKLPDYSEKIGSFYEMSRTLEDLCSLTLAEKKGHLHADYLLLVVDDLDRCSPAAIKQVFDAVRLVASISQVVVLVALDHRIAYAAVTKHYSEYATADRELTQLARDYLAKVFNLSVTLAAADASSIRNYIKHRLFDIPEGTRFGRPTAVASSQSLGKSTPVEAEAFCEFATSLHLTNPRELWRLRQAWSLLKGIALSARATDADVRRWMRHLFVREAVFQGTNEQRRTAEEFFSIKGSGSRPTLWSPQLTQAAHEVVEEFGERDSLVCAVLLPAAPPDWPKAAAPAHSDVS
jgi:hypothetical protein